MKSEVKTSKGENIKLTFLVTAIILVLSAIIYITRDTVDFGVLVPILLFSIVMAGLSLFFILKQVKEVSTIKVGDMVYFE